ncbi:unnamed protein product [Chrysoparadoxa australica]
MPNTRAPQIEVLELRDDFVKFVLSDTDTSVANSIRRVMIGEVPIMAMDLVTIYENSSVLQDEFLAHRLGLVPLRVDQHTKFEYNYDCDCEDHCEKCSVVFKLDVSWEEKNADRPAEMRDLPVLVTSEDLKIMGEDTRVEVVHFAPSEKLEFSQDFGILLAKLSKGQSIHLEAIAKKGIAKEHAKWSPVCVATYMFDPIIEINEDQAEKLTPSERESIVEVCPVKVYGIAPRTGALEVRNRRECMFCDECTSLAKALKERPEDEPVVKVTPREDRFIFSVETNGSISAEEVMLGALEAINNKLLTVRWVRMCYIRVSGVTCHSAQQLNWAVSSMLAGDFSDAGELVPLLLSLGAG